MEMQFTLTNICQAAADFWKQAGSHKVFAFQGPMGSGKTTFIHALCGVLHVRDTVNSPTFSIINEYEIDHKTEPGSVYHIDLYRLSGYQEAIQAGVADALYSGSICLVEWPERAPEIFPPDTVHVLIETVDTDTRKLKIPDILGIFEKGL